MVIGRAMNSPAARCARLLMLALLLAIAMVRPAYADDGSGPSVLRDTETELLFKDMSRPLIVAGGLDPNSVKVVLLNDPEINAFVASGQTVYIQSGLLEATDNVDQLQGVIAHELGHVVAGDSIRSESGAKQATGISILSLVLGAVAMAAGAGDAAMGIMMAGQHAAMGKFLAFTRAQEATADARVAPALQGRDQRQGHASTSSTSCRTRNIASPSIPRTASTATTRCRPERIQALEQNLKSDPAWNKPTDPALEARFQRVKAKLIGYVDPKLAVTKYPESDQSVPAHYARAYAYHLGGYPGQGTERSRRPARDRPARSVLPRAEGPDPARRRQAQGGHSLLREAVRRSDEAPMIAAMLGHALVATEDAEEFRRGQADPEGRGQPRQSRTRSPGTSSASSTTARATMRARRLPRPSAAISRPIRRWRWPAPKWP